MKPRKTTVKSSSPTAKRIRSLEKRNKSLEIALSDMILALIGINTCHSCTVLNSDAVNEVYAAVDKVKKK